ncbi:MAG: hypothetical protein D6748_04730 [Calditrichaeota bacterium]|nr:MAG: hypothetical protein D6748_04730 [Calditrichota bacterium]
MRKAFILLVLLFSNFFLLPVWAQKGPANRHLYILPDEKEPTYRFQNMRVSKESGVPIAMYRLDYPVMAASPEEMARQFLRDHAQLLKLTPTLDNLRFIRTVETPGGYHVHFQQMVDGYPLYRGTLVVTINRQHRVNFLMNGTKPAARLENNQPRVSLNQALQQAKAYLNLYGSMQLEEAHTVVYYNRHQTRLAHQITLVPAEANFGQWEILVDAHTGEIFRVEDKACYDHPKQMTPTSGSGWVFDPDPLTRARALYQIGTQFADNNDSDSDSLVAQIVEEVLLDINFDGSLYHLDGPYANIEDFESPSFGQFSQPDSNWHFTRNPQAFEAVNVYYHVDKSMRYINEFLGFSLMPYQYTGGVQVDPHGLGGADNSHYIPATGRIAWGEGGVDDAEDPDVILHELGHGLHDWLTVGGLSQEDGLSEGVGDYWAASYNRSTGFWTPADQQYYWVFQWDGHNEFWPGRVTNYSGHYPEDLTGSIHTDGQMWASTLMQIYDDLGRTVTDSDLLEALSMTNTFTNQEDAAQAFIQADLNLYGGAHLSVIEYWFTQRGYGVNVPVPHIVHDPLGDTEDVNGPYPVTATITASFPLTEVLLIYGTDGVFTDTLTMNGNGDLYTALIPGNGVPHSYNYYIFAVDSSGLASTHPLNAPTNYHSFFAGPDTLPPVITHTPLGDQAYQRWPATVRAQITDNLGVADAMVEYLVNGGVLSGSFSLSSTGDNQYEGAFDIDTSMVSIGDTIEYRIIATDSATQVNQSVDPPVGYHQFAIVNSLGSILVIDDDPTTTLLVKNTEKGQWKRDPVMNPFGASASLMENALTEAGYMVTVETPTTTDPNTWDQYDLIISSSGINEGSLSNTSYRTALINYSMNGGKFIIEGGEVGWTWRNDSEVMNYLLHSVDWNGDNEGDLNLLPSQANHPIVTVPHQLPATIPITYTAYGSEDAMTPGDAYLIYETTGEPGDAGISVYDNNGFPESAQSVYYAFNFAQISDSSIAKALLENTINYLLTEEPGQNSAPSSFSLLLPVNGDTVASTDSIFFQWQQAIDPDGDPVTYTLKIYNAMDTIQVDNLTDTSLVYTQPILETDTTYYWRVFASDGQLTTASLEEFLFYTPVVVNVGSDKDELPGTFHLSQNYPNPFNPATTIEFHVPQRAFVELVIFDILGRKVKTLVNTELVPQVYRMEWDGRDESGKPVATGIYFYRFKALDTGRKSMLYQQIRKLVLMK